MITYLLISAFLLFFIATFLVVKYNSIAHYLFNNFKIYKKYWTLDYLKKKIKIMGYLFLFSGIIFLVSAYFPELFIKF